MATPLGSPVIPSTVEEHPDPVSEAREALLGLAGRRLAPIPAELVVHHILRSYPYEECGFRVQRAALEAIMRRYRFAERDDLRVARRPRGGLGTYRCGRGPRSRARPYETRLFSIQPLDASCDCPDFLKGGLGLCKHVLTVLAELAKRRRLDKLAAKEAQVPASRLTWNPVRPLTGAGDGLAGIRYVSSRRPGPKMARHLAWAGDGLWKAREGSHLDAPANRRAFVSVLTQWASRNPEGTDPAVRSLLADQKARIERSRASKAAAKNLKQGLRTMRRKLYPYQVEGVRRLFDHGRLLLADDMGLGKTAQAIGACHILFQARRVRRGLLVVPASLRLQWEREWHAFTKVPVKVVDGSPDIRRALYEKHDRGFLITSYEGLRRDLGTILEWEPEIVVLDEAQRIKNWETKTAGSVKRINAPYRLVLTGTPLENRLDELASIMDWVDERAIEPKWRLTPWHTETSDGGKEVAGVRHLKTLRARLAPVMVRRRRPDVIEQLPPRTDTVVPVPLTDAQIDEHDAYNQPIVRLTRMARKRPLTQPEFLRLMQLLTMQRIIANGLAQRDFDSVWPAVSSVERPDDALLSTLNAPKLLELRALVERVAVEQQRKIVIFSQWRRMLALAQWAVSPILGDAGLRAAFFTGAESQRRRMENVVDLHEDPSVSLLFCSDAGGVGLNLQRAANCCINLDLPWNPAVLEQRIGRIYRLGQDDPIDVYNLVGQPGIESRIAGIVSDKKALFTGLFDGDSDTVLFDRSASFLAKLEKLVDVDSEPEQLGDEEDEDGEVLADAGEGMDALDDESAAGPNHMRSGMGHAPGPEAAESTATALAEAAGSIASSVGAAASKTPPEPDMYQKDATFTGDPAGTALAAEPPAVSTDTVEATPDSSSADGATEHATTHASQSSPPAGGSDEATERAATRSPQPPPLPDGDVVRQAFTGISVARTDSGGLRIEAEPEAAGTLGALLEGLGRLMKEAAKE